MYAFFVQLLFTAPNPECFTKGEITLKPNVNLKNISWYMCNNNEKSDILSLQLLNKISRVHITSRKTYNPHHHTKLQSDSIIWIRTCDYACIYLLIRSVQE